MMYFNLHKQLFEFQGNNPSLGISLELKMCALSLTLKESNDTALFILTGISFHNFAPLKAMDFCVKLRSYIGRNMFHDMADLVPYGCTFSVGK